MTALRAGAIAILVVLTAIGLALPDAVTNATIHAQADEAGHHRAHHDGTAFHHHGLDATGPVVDLGTMSHASTGRPRQDADHVSAQATNTSPGTRLVPTAKQRGMEFKGLTESGTGPCAGALRVDGSTAPVLCTHGPDPAPPGVDVTRRRGVRELRADVARSGPAKSDSAQSDGLPCLGDGVSGPRIQAIYAVASDQNDRLDAVVPLIEQYALNMDAAVSQSASETGGERHLRFVTNPDCSLNIAHVVLSPTGDDEFWSTVGELEALGYDQGGRKYHAWVDANVYCGIGTVVGDDSPGPGNWSNDAVSYARSDNGCWNYAELHEVFHNLGAVQLSAPHTTGGWHCTDEHDKMCYDDDGSGPIDMSFPCAPAHDELLDCNHDDYFHTSPGAGSYLATHWNTADSIFLSDESLDGDQPAAPINAAASAISTTQIQLTWDDVTTETGYRIKCWDSSTFVTCRDGLAADTTESTFDGLQPSIEYHFEVCAYNGAGEACAASVSAITPPITQPTAPTNLVAASLSESEIGLTWNDAADETSYRVSRLEGATWVVAGTPGSDSTSFVDGGRPAGAGYFFELCAINPIGETCHDGFVWGQTLDPPPGAPTTVLAVGISPSAIRLTWDDVIGETGYRIKRWDGASWPVIIDGLPSGSSSYKDGGLLADAEYAYYVCAYSGGGESCNNPWASGTTLRPTFTKIVDDRSAGFETSGSGWSVSRNGYRSGSLWTPVRRKFPPRHRAVWSARLGAPGTYQVRIRIPKRNATTRSAAYKVVTASGIESVVLSQWDHRGDWVSIGEYEFTTVGRVELKDTTGEPPSTGRRIAFDAVKFVPIDVSVAAIEQVPTPAATLEPTEGPAPVSTAEPAPEPSAEQYLESSPQPSPEQTLEPSPGPTPQPLPVSTPMATPDPTGEPTQDPRVEPSPEATAPPTSQSGPTPEPTPEPTLEPTPEPTPEPTAEPTPENIAPKADAGGPYEVDEGDTVRLDGRGSSDPDGEIVAHEWTRQKRLDDPASKRPRFSALDDGVIDIELNVSDDRGAADTDRAEITVRNVAPTLGDIEARPLPVGEELVIDDIAFTDPGVEDTHEVSVEWGDGTSSEAKVTDDTGSGAASAAHAYAEPGEYRVAVTVTDDDGGVGTGELTVSVAAEASEAAESSAP